MSAGFYLSFLVILLVTIGVGIAAKRTVRVSSDFSNASGKLRSGMVAGALVGGFVGGTSIIGTGEMAFQYGLAALWFTLGGGIGVMLIGLFAFRLRQMKVETLPALLGQVYGSKARIAAAIFLPAAIFIQVIAQVLSGLPLLSSVWNGSVELLAAVPALLILAYVFFGGFMGASVVGTLKTVLLIVLLVGTGMWLGNNVPVSSYSEWWEEGRFSLFSQGITAAWAQGGALVIGIFCTQAFLQPIFAAQDHKHARAGSFLAGIVIIIIGLVGSWIGMFMHDAHPDMIAREAVPQFFLTYSPGWIGGAALATILLSIVMTGAALVLSMVTILNQDVIQRWTTRFADDGKQLLLSRLLIVVFILIAYLIVSSNANTYILQWAFLSMTLRGVTVFLPIMCYLLAIGPIHPQWARMAIWGAPLLALACELSGLSSIGIDPLYVGGGWSLVTLAVGRLLGKSSAVQQVS